MDKILTVVIPTYNMESYLEKCLESVLVEQIIGLIEVMIVNDGSKDSSLSIAKRYQNRYPGSIVVVDKKNGNYGSCLNLAFNLAKGKYIRTLDADDCFDSTEFIKFIEKLRFLPNDVDLILTNFVINMIGTGKSKLIKQKGNFGKIYSHIIDFEKNGILYNIHAATYRTSILRDNHIKLSEGISYTDIELLVYSLFYCKNFVLFDISLYKYTIGRREQSVSMSSYLKNIDHISIILHRVVNNYNSYLSKLPTVYKNQIDALFPLIDIFSRLIIIDKRIKRSESNLYVRLLESIMEKDSYLSEKMFKLRKNSISYFKLWYNSNKSANESFLNFIFLFISHMTKIKARLFM